MNDETLNTPEIQPTETHEYPKPQSRLEQELIKINSMDLSTENKQIRMKQAWAKHGKRVYYVKKITPENKDNKLDPIGLGAHFLKVTGKKWEEATPEERRAVFFSETDLTGDVLPEYENNTKQQPQ